METVLEVNHLSKQFDTFSLEDVSFQLPKGSIMGFVGENGAGKTTTIKLILNLINKNSGQVKMFGLDHMKDEKQIKEQIGVVFDNSHFHDHLRPDDIAKIMRNIFQNWDDALFTNYLKTFKLPLNKTVKEYSKGMKMKLSIATALSHHPKLLLLDEATSGLDPIVRNEILDILLDFIQDEERSILLSSHITSDLEKIADYITFIHDGKIVFSESKDELIYEYGIMKCGIEDFKKISKSDIVGYRKGQFGYEVLVRDKKEMEKKYRGFVIDHTNIEEIILFHVRGEEQ
ncbi:ABC transporter ATP-binding protein [Brevibacillus daliensis]|uniref:ABC transporter ATP-binding protein n=1 Tax=Brevibacillus daliensis TaxID=2892995 RepID=UPI001E3CBB17|nr:ABC transporter ATP-binding protein [Brevibacillus daliensis]